MGRWFIKIFSNLYLPVAIKDSIPDILLHCTFQMGYHRYYNHYYLKVEIKIKFWNQFLQWWMTLPCFIQMHYLQAILRWSGDPLNDAIKPFWLRTFCPPPPFVQNYIFIRLILKVLSSHLNWRARLDSFDPLLKTGGPAIKKKSFLMIQSQERSIKQFSAAERFLRWLCPTKVTYRDFSVSGRWLTGAWWIPAYDKPELLVPGRWL